MSNSETPQEAQVTQEDEDIAAVYGSEADEVEHVSSVRKKEFKPWHHPVKQFVRTRQWLEQVHRLLASRHGSESLKYLSLPGGDMFDVRLLGQALKTSGIALELLGFNSANDEQASSSQLNAESALRQEGLITDNSLTLGDRVQDIAVVASHAHRQLSNWGPFDVVNLDLCGHLAAPPNGPTVLDALGKLVAHQRATNKPWLLMLTMRVEPNHLGLSHQEFSDAISQNIALGEGFSEGLAASLGFELTNLTGELERAWQTQSDTFAKLYSVGLGKYLLWLCHNQIQDPASVELKSCMGYRVYADSPDMLSVAFLIKPGQKREFPARPADAPVAPNVEIAHALQIVRKSGQMLDLDAVLQDAEMRRDLIIETEELLKNANYDISTYRNWVDEFRRLVADEAAELSA